MVFWFWYKLVVNTIKIALVFTFVLIGFAVYLRGMELFFSKDVPLAFGYFWANRMLFMNQMRNVVATSVRTISNNVSGANLYKLAGNRQNDASYFEAHYESMEQPVKQLFLSQLEAMRKVVWNTRPQH